MSRFVAEVKGSTAMNWTDINLIAENVLIPLFSEIYGHTELKSLNTSENPNFPAIDLGDKTTRIAYQITSTPTSTKIKSTLKKFVDNELYNEYDHLIIYILTEKQNSYQGRGFAEIIDGKFTFDKDNDIRDYQDLLREISNFPMEKLQKIEELLEQQFGAKNQENEPQDITEWIESVNNYWRGEESSSQIKIDRREVRHALYDFAYQDHCIVIGSPGVGKTYLLKELLNQLKTEDIPHLFLPIDLLGDSDPKEWPEGFSFQGNLIDALKSVPTSDKKGIIVFDGFDALRDDRKCKNFLILIQRAIQELKNWNVIVTVRTYDAKKSNDLLDLFGSLDNSVQAPYHIEDILCRHFNIPFLEKYEILLALEQIECPIYIYENGSIEFQQDILSKPFNLWLLEKILQIPGKDPDFSQVYSEIQLLQEYLDRHLTDRNKKHILDGIAREMVKKRSLSVEEFDIYEDLELDKPVRMDAFENLLSDDILTVDPATKQNITFSHNILFDYAVSVRIIEDEPDQLEKFITEDPSRPLFLRPSLTYYFTRLWYYKPDNFWRVFWHILPKDQSVHLRLVARLIPPSVIANEARKIEQLTPLLQELQNRKPIAEEAITRLMQSLQNLQIKREIPWIYFHDRVSQNLSADFVWDLARLTSDILEKTTNPYIVNVCGHIGRQLLAWVWQEKETSKDDWYNRLGGHWVVPIVVKTFHTKVEESRVLLEKVLELLNENNFPIVFLSRLSEHIDKIWDHDPEFVVGIYRAVFSHQFNSEGKTQKGGSILGFTTYRSQDFQICQYHLVKHFPEFLQKKPKHAIHATIQSLNYFVIHTHIALYLKQGRKPEDLIQTFNLLGAPVYFIEDDSHFWDAPSTSDVSVKDEPIEMVDIMFEYIAKLAKSGDSDIDIVLEIFYQQVWVAFLWKRLLRLASQYPKVFAPRLYELCIAKPILLHLEVSYELGLFLENAASEFTSDQLRQIEDSILALPAVAKDKENDDYLKTHRNSLLARIPKELLSTDEAKSIRKKMEQENNVPDNLPPVSFTFESGTVTEEKWLRNKGVDTTTPENQELQQYSQTLEKFSDDWKKDDPTSEAIEFIILQLRVAYTTITSDTPESNELINILWRKLVECASILVGIAETLDSESFTFCRKIILEGARHELPRPNPELDAQFNSTGYSPFPRHEATKGLTILAYSNPDTEILDAIEELADDPVPSVRMLIAMQIRNVYIKNPDRYRKIVDKRSELEKNSVVQECLYRTLNYLVAHRKENENRTTEVMSKLLRHTPHPEVKTGTSDSFINLLMWLVIERENQWAIDYIQETWINDPIQFSDMLTRVVRHTIKTYLDPKQFETDVGTERVKRAIGCLKEVISVSIDKIKVLCNVLNQNVTEENQQKLQNTYRVIDQVISSFYYLFAHEKNHSENQTETISDDLRFRFYEEVKPLMNQVIDFADDPDTGLMFASTAHDFMQVLTSFLRCNPKEIILLAERVANSSERFGYNLDSIAVKDIVDFVEIVLADYRHVVRDNDDCMESLLNLLDLFAKTGWTDALNLVWRLDEVFR